MELSMLCCTILASSFAGYIFCFLHSSSSFLCYLYKSTQPTSHSTSFPLKLPSSLYHLTFIKDTCSVKMACPIHGSKCLYTRYRAETDIVLGVGNRGHSRHSGPPRTLEEACQGFEERDIPFSECKYSVCL